MLSRPMSSRSAQSSSSGLQASPPYPACAIERMTVTRGGADGLSKKLALPAPSRPPASGPGAGWPPTRHRWSPSRSSRGPSVPFRGLLELEDLPSCVTVRDEAAEQPQASP
jgi:hypothetical protein